MKNDILDALKWRYATKKYDQTKKISQADWNLLKEALVLSPSSYGLQPWHFIVVQNPELRKTLRVASWGQSAIEECSHLVVFTTLREMTSEHISAHIHQTAHLRGTDPSTMDGYKKFIEQKIVKELPKEKHQAWNQRQAYIAMGFLLATAALLKIDSTPIEGIDTEKYDEILKLNGTPWATVAAVALGYRHAEDAQQNQTKSRFPADQVISQIE